MRVVLGSASPRRRDLLLAAGVVPEIVVPGVDESLLPDEQPIDAAARLACAKAAEVHRRLGSFEGLLIAADTVVSIGCRHLPKPSSVDEATEHLRLLAGRVHLVHTAVEVIRGHDGAARRGIGLTRVTIGRLDESQIEAYVGSGEGFDKAGGYAIQGLGSLLIESIEGSYSNVVGLPMGLLYRLACALGFDLLAAERDPTGHRRRDQGSA